VAFSFSHHPHIQQLPHSLQGGGNAVNAGGVADIGQAVYFQQVGVGLPMCL